MQKILMFVGALGALSQSAMANTLYDFSGNYTSVSPGQYCRGTMTITEDAGKFAITGVYERPHADSSNPDFNLGLERQEYLQGCLDTAAPLPSQVGGHGVAVSHVVIATPCAHPASFITVDNTSIAANGTLTYSNTWGQGCKPGQGLSSCQGVGMNNYQYTPNADGTVTSKVWSEASGQASTPTTCVFRKISN